MQNLHMLGIRCLLIHCVNRQSGSLLEVWACSLEVGYHCVGLSVPSQGFQSFPGRLEGGFDVLCCQGDKVSSWLVFSVVHPLLPRLRAYTEPFINMDIEDTSITKEMSGAQRCPSRN